MSIMELDLTSEKYLKMISGEDKMSQGYLFKDLPIFPDPLRVHRLFKFGVQVQNPATDTTEEENKKKSQEKEKFDPSRTFNYDFKPLSTDAHKIIQKELDEIRKNGYAVFENDSDENEDQVVINGKSKAKKPKVPKQRKVGPLLNFKEESDLHKLSNLSSTLPNNYNGNKLMDSFVQMNEWFNNTIDWEKENKNNIPPQAQAQAKGGKKKAAGSKKKTKNAKNNNTKENKPTATATDGQFGVGESISAQQSLNNSPLDAKQIADLLLVSYDQLQNFELPDLLRQFELHHPLKQNYEYSKYCKFMAFQKWQQGDIDDCTYYLCEAHAPNMKRDMIDHQSNYFSKKNEPKIHVSRVVPPERQVEYEKIAKIQLSQCKRCERSHFKQRINGFEKVWNVIQLTTLSSGINRFGHDVKNEPDSCPLFITNVFRIPETTETSYFTTLVDKADFYKGAPMKSGIMSEFLHLLYQNKLVSSGQFSDKKKYWAIRGEHNKTMMDIVKAIEDNWISPWEFLFPGLLADDEICKNISSIINSFALTWKTNVTDSQTIVLFKLASNFPHINEKYRSFKVFRVFVAHILNTQVSKEISRLASDLHKIGETILPTATRWPTILIIDQDFSLDNLPWENMSPFQSTSVTRMLSVAQISIARSTLKVKRETRNGDYLVDPESCTYLLNPDGSLKKVQERFEEYFKLNTKWEGWSGKGPKEPELLKALEEKDIYLYCGHGCGYNYLRDSTIRSLVCRAVPLLMGCSSVRFTWHGLKNQPSSVVNSYMLGSCWGMVGFLWEITDVECDRITIDLIERWIPGPGNPPAAIAAHVFRDQKRYNTLERVVLHAKNAATQTMTRAACVIYGLPNVKTKYIPEFR